MKLIDCFMYFDEDLILDIRLNVLKNIVDKFVIVEAKKDHAGNQKNLNFDIENFSKFKDKIHYIAIDDLPVSKNFFKKNWRSEWHTENAHRNKLELGYLDASDNDLIMISDIDEIPNPKIIKNFKLENIYGCFMQMNLQKNKSFKRRCSRVARNKNMSKKEFKITSVVKKYQNQKKTFLEIF